MKVFILKSAKELRGRHSEIDRRESAILALPARRAFSMYDNYDDFSD